MLGGRPGPIVTLRVLPDGLTMDTSLWPVLLNCSCLVPPPPNPSFFTVNVRLWRERKEGREGGREGGRKGERRERKRKREGKK